jgi:hypothetical protein
VVIAKSIGVCHVVLHKLLSRFGVVADLVVALAVANRVCLVDLVLIPEKLSPVQMVMVTWVVGVSHLRLQNPLAAHSVVLVFKVAKHISVVRTVLHRVPLVVTSVQTVDYLARLAVMHTGTLNSDV